MPLESERADQTSTLTRIATHINGIVGVCRGRLRVWTFSTNCVPINDQNHAVFAFVSLKCVPFPIADSTGSFGLVKTEYLKRKGFVTVDGQESPMVPMVGDQTVLDVEGKLYLGGLPSDYRARDTGHRGAPSHQQEGVKTNHRTLLHHVVGTELHKGCIPLLPSPCCQLVASGALQNKIQEASSGKDPLLKNASLTHLATRR
uniref:Laminin G domain-containing protein n=1 Tax=Equus caballus TaxID=9796 RepID=A0A3Q2I3M8_HORSE